MMKKSAKSFLASLLLVVTIFSLPPAHAVVLEGGDCPIPALNKDYAQLMLSVFGKAGVRPLMETKAEVEQLDKMTSGDISVCTDGFSAFGENSTKIGLVAMYLLASPLVFLVGYMLFFNKSAQMMISGENNKGKIAFTVVSLATIIVMLFPVHKLTELSGDTELDDAYSPLHRLMFAGVSLGLKQAESVSTSLSPVLNLTLPLYTAPMPHYLTLNDQGVDGSGYQLNKMSAILDYAECLVVEMPDEARSVLKTPYVAIEDDQIVAHMGGFHSNCQLDISIPTNKETGKQLEELKLPSLTAADFSKREVIFVQSVVQELVAEALRYKQELMRVTADVDAPLDERYQSFQLTCKEALLVPTDGGFPDGSTVKLVDLVKLERQAEVALSRIYTRRFYSPDYDADSKSRVVDVADRCNDENIEACVVDVCSFDPTQSQLGLMDCAIAVNTLHSSGRIKANEEKGFITRLLNLWQLSSKAELPRDVQTQLANIEIEVKAERSDFNKYDSARRSWKDKYDQALFETNIAYDGVKDLIPVSQEVNVDLFGVARVATCMDKPNQEVYETDSKGEQRLVAKCGTVLQTIDTFGDNLLRYALLLKGGSMSMPLISKVQKKLIGGKIDKERPEGATDGGLSDKKSGNGNMMKVALGALGFAASGGALAMMRDSREEPFSNVSSGIDALSATVAFSVGAALGEKGALNFILYVLFGLGLFFKFGVKFFLIALCLYYLIFVWFKTLIVNVPTTLYRALSVMADENGVSSRVAVLLGQLCVLVLLPSMLLFVVYSIPPFMDYVAGGSLSALGDWVTKAMDGGTQSSKVIQLILWVVLLGVALVMLPLASLALIHRVHGLLSDVCGDTAASMIAAKEQDSVRTATNTKGAIEAAKS